jgi:hypothetical protein
VHQHRRIGVARGRRQVLDDDRRSEPGLHLVPQRRKPSPGQPAVNDERALRGADPADRREPLEVPGDVHAQVTQPRGMRQQQLQQAVFGGGDRLRELGQAALDRLHGGMKREPFERLGERHVADLCAPEQRSHGLAVAVREHDQAAEGACFDGRRQQRELLGELLAQLAAEGLHN